MRKSWNPGSRRPKIIVRGKGNSRDDGIGNLQDSSCAASGLESNQSSLEQVRCLQKERQKENRERKQVFRGDIQFLCNI